MGETRWEDATVFPTWGDSTTVWATDTTQLEDTDGETTTTTMLVMDTETDLPGEEEPTDLVEEELLITDMDSLLRDMMDLDPLSLQVVTFTLSPDMPVNTKPQQVRLEEITFQAPTDSQVKPTTTELRRALILLRDTPSQDMVDTGTEHLLIGTTKSLDTHANQKINVQLPSPLGQTTRIYEIWYASHERTSE